MGIYLYRKMSETRQVKQVPPQPQPQVNEDEENQNQSEEEPMDSEVINASKNNTISDDYKKIDLTKKDSKNKSKRGKKNNNKKGDFLDLAQEKGIEFKFEYEDKEIEKKNYYQKDNKNFSGKPYQKNYEQKDNKNFQQKNFKYQNKKNFGFQNRSKNNKFDQANMMYQNGNKNMNPYPQQQNNMGQQQDFNFDPFFTPERTCEEILGYIFSIEFLNRELYLRKRISTEGLIDINHVMIYNKIKQRGFTLDQVIESIKNLGTENFEITEVEGVQYIKIVQWANMELFSIEQIQSQKRSMRNQKYQNMNYIAMQNNYFFPPNNQFGQMGQMPQGMMPMDNMQQQPYMMNQMGGMNMPFPQQNYNPQMNQQFMPQEDNNQSHQN